MVLAHGVGTSNFPSDFSCHVLVEKVRRKNQWIPNLVVIAHAEQIS